MTEEARAARNAYHRKWRKENPEKAKKIQDRYWAKKAASERQKTAENGREEASK